MLDRTRIVRSLIKLDRPLDQLRTELQTFPWDSPALATLTGKHIRDILLKFSRGDLTASEVCLWAETVEMRDDIDYEAQRADEISMALRELTDPEFSGPLDHEAAARLLKRLS